MTFGLLLFRVTLDAHMFASTFPGPCERGPEPHASADQGTRGWCRARSPSPGTMTLDQRPTATATGRGPSLTAGGTTGGMCEGYARPGAGPDATRGIASRGHGKPARRPARPELRPRRRPCRETDGQEAHRAWKVGGTAGLGSTRAGRAQRTDEKGRHPGVPAFFGWCGREDSNFHGLSATATSTLRVYQFRHDRISWRNARQPRRALRRACGVYSDSLRPDQGSKSHFLKVGR